MNQNEILKVLTSKSIGNFYFPYVSEFKEFQNQKVRHCEKLLSISKLDSLGSVAVKPIEFYVQAQVPYSNLALQMNYKLNSYKKDPINKFVSKHETRLFSLRKGAEDELTQIDKSLLKISKPLKKAGFLSDKKVDILSGVSNETQIIDLIPSPQLSKPIEYSPMHIFVNFI